MNKLYKLTKLNIKSWAEEDRPREKFLLKGKSSLSDAELLAILIGSGTTSISAVDLAKQILNMADNDLNVLALFSLKDLMKLKGMGEAKAISIAAALELGRRRKDTESGKKARITTSKDAFDIMKAYMSDLRHEEFWILLLNRSNIVIKKEQISIGGVAGTSVDVKIIFHKALENLASCIVLVHNHPSGNLLPSEEDISITRQIREASKILDIRLLDHIIFTDNGYYSFADEEMI